MRFTEPTPEQVQNYRDWLETVPPRVKEVAEKFDIWSLYLMKSTKQKVFILAFDENEEGVTLTVKVSGEFNLVCQESDLSGVDPNDLAECDLPKPGELVGTLDADPEFSRTVFDKPN